MVKKTTIIGSTNLDKVTRVPRLANSGETLSTPQHQEEVMGGKGLNQAVAVARAGGQANFITKVGAGFDLAGRVQEDGLNLDYVLESQDAETGQAYITVSKATGDNIIYVYEGANGQLLAKDVWDQKAAFEDAAFCLAQLEIPLETVLSAFKDAHEAGVVTVLNPAPVPDQENFPKELLAESDLVIPNEHETELLTNIPVTDRESLIQNADFFFKAGVKHVLITLGDKGAFYKSVDGKEVTVNAIKTTAIDTTAAGDTFIGALLSRLVPSFANIEGAIKYGVAAASLTVAQPGALPSIPFEDAILAQLPKTK
ncbi:ribokinase [Fructobacillus evanidus]|uniref:Ribokinase n=1 Tax=Fructobacillus evanidus TaxID=3064281 RepID=A0ABN9YY25_9LACO|nr:Sugar or nucleoside kinase [Fructobacillus sp. LMG 32999]CAK1242375.1 Sugar or nucleoside kinase [Fructobacillus sp. LMG 32999]CAK1248029.1 Sugar or nucleoside kinase [Fructobacillus sp. LMG 32999]CAK1249182.1 Sugar or nucleoside kinase [Fructobacillus sp. LMG 32999]CAK1250008.1 Sugar or nucleoside kinase [Fructobacillus sp. LMG 32999]